MADLEPAAVAAERHWPESSCYLDLWTTTLARWGFEPRAALGFVLGMDFEGDQFTFLKPPLEDLERLHGIVVQELALYEPVEIHAVRQVARGRMVLVEVDGFHLPDTRGTSYQREHTKTTIGIETIDLAARHLAYVHNTGFYELSGEDFDRLFYRDAGRAPVEDRLPPYAETARRAFPGLEGQALAAEARALLRHHLRRAPPANPVLAFHDALPAQLESLFAVPERFHPYAFNTLRQLGSGFERLADHADWLLPYGIDDRAAEAGIAACRRIATSAKALQFRVARLVGRRRVDPCTEALTALAADFDEARAAFATIAG